VNEEALAHWEGGRCLAKRKDIRINVARSEINYRERERQRERERELCTSNQLKQALVYVKIELNRF